MNVVLSRHLLASLILFFPSSKAMEGHSCTVSMSCKLPSSWVLQFRVPFPPLPQSHLEHRVRACAQPRDLASSKMLYLHFLDDSPHQLCSECNRVQHPSLWL